MDEIEMTKALLMQTFKFFLNLCKRHNLTYYACGGTAIGAVRHQGIIPWDDDIDVYMTRSEYERLVSIKDEFEGTDYELVDMRDETYQKQGYTFCIVKIVHKKSTIWEYEPDTYIQGSYIDIFILDETSGNIQDMRELAERLFYARMQYNRAILQVTKQRLLSTWKQRNFPELIRRFIDIIWYTKQKRRYLKKLLSLDEQVKKQKGDHYFCYGIVTTSAHEIFPKEWFKSTIEMPFEDVMITLPIKYHEYLTQQFGDYMTPPPVSQQKSHHSRFYVNLTRRISDEEIRKLRNHEPLTEV